MTAIECVKEYQYDVSIYLSDDGLWYWDINGGYCSVGAHDGYDDIKQAEEELHRFLKYFEPFEK